MRWFILFLLVAPSEYLFASNLIWTDSSRSTLIGKYLEYLPTKRDSKISDVLFRTDWKQSEVEVLNFGSTGTAYWMRFTVENRSKERDLYFEVNMPYIDHVELYDSVDFGVYTSHIIGDIYPFNFRLFPETLPVYTLTFDSIRTFYVKIYSDQSLVLPMKVKNELQYNKSYKTRITFFGIFTGIISIIFVSSLLVYLILKETVYTSYAIYLVTVYFTQAIATSQLYEYLLTSNVIVAKYALTVATTSLGIAALEFVKRFLFVKTFSQFWHITMVIFQISFIVQPVIVILGFPVSAFTFINVVFLLSSLLVATTAVLAFRHKVDFASYFFMAWITFIVGSIMYTLNNLGLVPYSYVVNYTMPVGVAIETVTLSMALAVRIRRQGGLKGNAAVFLESRKIFSSPFLEPNDNGESERFNLGLLNDHLITNIFNAAYVKVSLNDRKGALKIMNQASMLIRGGLSLLKQHRCCINEEIEYYKLMAKVIGMKINHKIRLVVEIDSLLNVYEKCYPTLLLQPFFENCLKYGYVHRSEKVIIKLKYIHMGRSKVRVELEDFGLGISKYNVRKSVVSLGMEITKSRVEAMVRDGIPARLEIVNKADHPAYKGSTGVLVRIDIPKLV